MGDGERSCLLALHATNVEVVNCLRSSAATTRRPPQSTQFVLSSSLFSLPVPLFGSAATPTVCLILLLLLLPLFLQLHENELHSHTHTLAHTRHRKHTLVLSHKMCDVYLPLRPTRLC